MCTTISVGLNFSQDELFSGTAWIEDAPSSILLPMVKKIGNRLKRKPRHFIREWRKFRNLNQAQLAERVDMAVPSISQIETYKQGWTDETLAALADALSCEPGDLLARNPLDKDAPWSIWDKLKPEQRRMAMVMIRSLVVENTSTGTDG